jgi:hypothetical protein
VKFRGELRELNKGSLLFGEREIKISNDSLSEHMEAETDAFVTY